MKLILLIPRIFLIICLIPFALVFGPALFTKRRLF